MVNRDVIRLNKGKAMQAFRTSVMEGESQDQVTAWLAVISQAERNERIAEQVMMAQDLALCQGVWIRVRVLP